MKAIVNALTLALLDCDLTGDIAAARAFAEKFVADNAELFVSGVPASQKVSGMTARIPAGIPSGSVAPGELGPDLGDAIRPSELPRASQGEVKAAEVAAQQAKGAPLCPNCQQSSLAHAPGCIRNPGTGYPNSRDITAKPLPPIA